jgi:hypothetical protein
MNAKHEGIRGHHRTVGRRLGLVSTRGLIPGGVSATSGRRVRAAGRRRGARPGPGPQRPTGDQIIATGGQHADGAELRRPRVTACAAKPKIKPHRAPNPAAAAMTSSHACPLVNSVSTAPISRPAPSPVSAPASAARGGLPPGRPLDQPHAAAHDVEPVDREAFVGKPTDGALDRLVVIELGHGVPGGADRIQYRTCSATRPASPARPARAITGTKAGVRHEIRVVERCARPRQAMQQSHLPGVLSN